MGTLDLHGVGELQRKYGLRCFVETGTWRGDGLLHALQFPFVRLWSIEASRELAEAAHQRVSKIYPEERWEILLGDSVRVLDSLVNAGADRASALWWLDAHLPERYGASATRLPLLEEVQTIVSVGHHEQDVFILDDWRLYEQHPYASGCWPWAPGDGHAVRALLEPTHTLTVDLRAEGALLAVPRA